METKCAKIRGYAMGERKAISGRISNPYEGREVWKVSILNC